MKMIFKKESAVNVNTSCVFHPKFSFYWLCCLMLFNLSVPLPVWVGLIEEAEESREKRRQTAVCGRNTALCCKHEVPAVLTQSTVHLLLYLIPDT